MSLNPREIQQVLEALEASDWEQAVVTVGDVRIAVARGGAGLPSDGPPALAAAAPAPAPVAAAPAAPAAAAPAAPVAPPAPAAAAMEEGVQVVAPSVGVFWRSPQPGAPAFVEVGSTVTQGQVLGIVEVMKLMNNITAPCAGTVAAVRAENAQQVEHGDVLIVLTPAS